jgi:NitT/TauT family transport system permease protein
MMALVIIAYDQLFFRPIVAWADRFRFEQTASTERPESWVFDLLRRTRALPVVLAPLGNRRLLLALEPAGASVNAATGRPRTLGRAGLAGLVWLGVAAALGWTAHYVLTSLSVGDVGRRGLALITMLRVIVLIALASLIWVPLGVMIGLRPRLAERVQPSPSSLPPSRQRAVSLCGDRHRRWNLLPDIWLSPLMILGTQWYILFNVIAGPAPFPTTCARRPACSACVAGNGGARSRCRASSPITSPAR